MCFVLADLDVVGRILFAANLSNILLLLVSIHSKDSETYLFMILRLTDHDYPPWQFASVSMHATLQTTHKPELTSP